MHPEPQEITGNKQTNTNQHAKLSSSTVPALLGHLT